MLNAIATIVLTAAANIALLWYAYGLWPISWSGYAAVTGCAATAGVFLGLLQVLDRN
jgi:asparagine N-glycosylation enzyme membrane subunit Stt3